MASSTGDVRRALELLRRALDMSESELRKAGKQLTPANCKGAVTVRAWGTRGEADTVRRSRVEGIGQDHRPAIDTTHS